jgi:hypothetical protein
MVNQSLQRTSLVFAFSDYRLSKDEPPILYKNKEYQSVTVRFRPAWKLFTPNRFNDQSMIVPSRIPISTPWPCSVQTALRKMPWQPGREPPEAEYSNSTCIDSFTTHIVLRPSVLACGGVHLEIIRRYRDPEPVAPSIGRPRAITPWHLELIVWGDLTFTISQSEDNFINQ